MNLDLNALLHEALEHNAGHEVVQKLLDVHYNQEAMEGAREAAEAFVALKAACMKIDLVQNARANTGKGGSYDYLKLPHLLEEVIPVLSKHKFSHRWKCVNDCREAGTNDYGRVVYAGTVTVTCIMMHNNGHTYETSMSAPMDTTGSKNAVQAIGSTNTYLQRYTLLSLVGLTAGLGADDDGNGSSGATSHVITMDKTKRAVPTRRTAPVVKRPAAGNPVVKKPQPPEPGDSMPDTRSFAMLLEASKSLLSDIGQKAFKRQLTAKYPTKAIPSSLLEKIENGLLNEKNQHSWNQGLDTNGVEMLTPVEREDFTKSQGKQTDLAF